MRERHQLHSGFRTGRSLEPRTLNILEMSGNDSINVTPTPAQPQFSENQWTPSSNAENSSVSIFFATYQKVTF